MAETRSIRVKKVEAADPELTVTLESADGGTFPTNVKVSAAVSNAVDGGNYSGNGTATTNGRSTSTDVVVSFTDPNYSTENTLHYDLTVYFSSDGVNWTQLPAGSVSGADGDVTATHDAGDAMVMAEAEPAADGGGTAPGAKNKGCLAFLGMLPF